MKKIVITKNVRHTQIGHVYEHMYASELTHCLRERGLFAYVDYFVDARTYYEGYVQIQVELYSKRAQTIELRGIESIRIEITEDTVAGALLQIMAEKESDVEEIDDAFVYRELAAYDEDKWHKGRSTGGQVDRLLDDKLALIEVSADYFGNLMQRITYRFSSERMSDKNIPAFIVIANALRSNLQEDVSDNSYCFTYSDTIEKADNGLSDVNLYKIDKRQADSLTYEIDVARDLVDNMLHNGFIDRLSEYMLTLSEMPVLGEERRGFAENVNIETGKEYWLEFGEKEKIKQILRNVDIEFYLGGSASSLRVAEIIPE